MRPALPNDLDAVAAIERESFSDPWTRESFAQLIGRPHLHFFVAMRDDAVIGFSIAYAAAGEAEIANIAVAGTVRGQGIGGALLRHLLSTLRTDGAAEVWLEVRANPHAGTGWAGIAGDVDLDAVFGQITRAFRRGGPWALAKAGKARVAVGGHAWSDITIEIPQAITGRVGVHSASGDVRIEGLTGEMVLNTMSGDVRVMRTSGDLVL